MVRGVWPRVNACNYKPFHIQPCDHENRTQWEAGALCTSLLGTLLGGLDDHGHFKFLKKKMSEFKYSKYSIFKLK